MVSFVVAGFLLKTSKVKEEDDLEEATRRMQEMKSQSKGGAAAHAAVDGDLTTVRKIIVACDAGMGSSAMGAGVLRESNVFLNLQASDKEQAIRFAGEQLVKGGYVEPEYVPAMLEREKLTSTYLGESIAVPHGTIEAKDRVLRTGVVFCQYPQGVRFGDEEDEVARLVIGIAARNNEHIQVITSLTNALDDDGVIERLANTSSVQEVLDLLGGKKRG
ncbi:PTS system mannitol-specific EIICBA component [compost metagenome]